ncbi:uncharacterized protein MKK02DRAFT_45017 [Dioszegia hungarica]|uniref:Uncharacterized protein n=1 Tax=Dioszegia hungarica TaxID=4972 RepID=A0AA38LV99_9TREE|nr:uncharacterized protein MKK02DRAFT_45017 [Dioszegia hungarica]KAI9636313.1 hypothetical protein MKK02DRAFT_45017 [Dioszegia hungarica]
MIFSVHGLLLASLSVSLAFAGRFESPRQQSSAPAGPAVRQRQASRAQIVRRATRKRDTAPAPNTSPQVSCGSQPVGQPFILRTDLQTNNYFTDYVRSLPNSIYNSVKTPIGQATVWVLDSYCALRPDNDRSRRASAQGNTGSFVFTTADGDGDTLTCTVDAAAVLTCRTAQGLAVTRWSTGINVLTLYPNANSGDPAITLTVEAYTGPHVCGTVPMDAAIFIRSDVGTSAFVGAGVGGSRYDVGRDRSGSTFFVLDRTCTFREYESPFAQGSVTDSTTGSYIERVDSRYGTVRAVTCTADAANVLTCRAGNGLDSTRHSPQGGSDYLTLYNSVTNPGGDPSVTLTAELA